MRRALGGGGDGGKKNGYHRDTEITEGTEIRSVIPAKAGIHLADNSLVDGWIPAFAGMTTYYSIFFSVFSVPLW